MGIFRRGSQEPTGPNLGAIPAFWEWWTVVGRPAAEEGIASGDWAEFPSEIGIRLDAIDPGLEWELSPGRGAEHALVISAGGISERRALAERCIRAAPPGDATWEFHSARQPTPDSLESRLQLPDGSALVLREAMVSLALDDERGRADVTVFHAGFGAMPEQEQVRASFLLLDWMLGEDGVERWVGEIATTTERPADALPVEALWETVDALAARSGDDTWVLGHGELAGAPVLFSARRPLKWIDNPLLDLHIALTTPYGDQTAEGFPSPDALDALRRFEDQVVEALAERALLVAHLTTRGERTFHLYADHTDTSALEAVRRVSGRWPGAEVDAALDPGWQGVAAFA